MSSNARGGSSPPSGTIKIWDILKKILKLEKELLKSFQN